MTTQPASRGDIKMVFIVPLPILGCILICGLVYLAMGNWPRYVGIDLPKFEELHWSNTQKTIQVWSDDSAKFFIQRWEGTFDPECCADVETWNKIIAEFDRWFLSHNWERANRGDVPPTCNVFLPESNFLSSGPNGYVVYKPPDSPDFQWVPTVCLAVWPAIADDHYFYHNIVIVTANPSFMTQFNQSFD